MKSIAEVMVLLFVLVLAGCAPTSAPAPEAETSSTGPDPTVVDADHYKIEFENERVRVVRITYGPGEKSVMHYHPDNVGVFLTDLKGRFTLPDGSTEEIETKTGDAGWADGGQHLPENLGDESMELVLVELKESMGGGDKTGETGPDPTEVDSDHYKTEFENDSVRIIRIAYGPGEKSVMHYHPAGVAVFLNDQKVKFTLPDGSTEEAESRSGEALWTEANQHLPENVAGESMELILVELKK